ncbi:D-2-hydroxyacid dehydrogenase [Vibrio nigripulchritudo]|uniref:D-2-hydroxyacid dehydrogenase n=1 Tax=Vibrio nigripulchritudo TaxID=28173 RepID=UPI0007E4E496|nr:D-2-hydroxyacid dehydrogenase [Vibrio nigripulchritudo]
MTKPSFEHQWVEYGKSRQDQVVERLADADIVVTNKVPIREETLAQLPGLKMVAVAATGYDVIDLDACKARGITVANVRGYAVNTVPEHTFSLILALRRSLVGYRQDVIDGEWQKSEQFCFFNHDIQDLANSRLGIIGSGAIGQAVAKIGRAMGMEVVFSERKGSEMCREGYLPFGEVIETSDVISLHAPLTPNTRDMISEKELTLMKPSAILVNASRGGLINEPALVKAIKDKQIAAVGLDVLTQEPPRNDHPIFEIASLPNVIVTPHTAWASLAAMQEVWRQVIDNIEGHVEGRFTGNEI